MVVFLLTTGDGSDGNQWDVHGIYESEQGARQAKAEFERPRSRPDGSQYVLSANEIEIWKVE